MKRVFTAKLRSRLLLAACSLLLSMQLHAQNITMNFKGTVQQAIELLQKNYNYSVVIKTNGVDLKKQIEVKASNKTVGEVVNQIFASQNVACSVEGRNILVKSKEPEKDGDAQKVRLITVRGTVTDASGMPIPGAAVYNRQTQRGTVCDARGQYTLQVPANSQITVSFLGYDDLSVAVNNKTLVNVSLTEKASDIDEIVVIGYGTQKKSDVTGAVAQINMEKMADKQSISLADYLRGSVAGLNIQRSASTSGQTSFEIRGQTSLGTTTSPLLVVDGMIFNGELNDINPNDIASVSVMKDASSAAVYGANAANGVIIITTKEGTGDKPTIRFDAKTSLSILTRKPASYDVNGYLQVRADKLIGEGAINQTKPEYYTNPYKLQGVDLATWMGYSNAGAYADPTEVWLDRLALRPNEKTNYYNYRSTDWVDDVFRTGVIQDYNVSVSGKSKSLSYYWSAGFLDNKGVVRNDDYQNVRTRVNLSNKITDFLEVGIRANLSSAKNDGQPADWAVAYNNSPLGDKYNEDGTYTWYPNGDNMAKNPFEKTQWDVYKRTTSILGTVYAKISLPWGFAFESSFNNRWKFQDDNSYKPSWTLDGSAGEGIASRRNTRQYDWSIENILRWNMTFNDIHRFDVTLLQSAAKWKQHQTTAGASKFTTSELLGWHALDMAEIQTSASEDQVDTKASYMARLNYTLMDRYMLSFTIRRDGYSAFGQQNPWADFPAVAAAWRISEEDFMKSVNWISNLKLRFSYGKNGNSNIGRYTALAGLANDFYLTEDKQNVVTLYPTSMGNSQLMWEETLAMNFGLDWGLFKNRLNVTAEVYKMKTTNMLMDRGLPTLTGYSKVKANLGQVNNKGLEITINSVNLNTKNLRWTSDLTFSLNRNEIKHLYGDLVPVTDSDGNIVNWKESDDPTNGWYIGHAIDEIYGYKITGVWQNDEAAEAMALGFSPGDYKTYLKEGNTSYSTDDYLWQGYTKPRYRIALNNSFTLFDNLTVSFMLRSELGHKKANNEICVGSYADRVSQMKFPYWTPENQSNYWGKLGARRTGTLYRNASFLRIENVSIAYSLPKRWINKIALQNAKVFFNLDNAYCFDDWLYWDVETKAPTPMTFTFGINFTL
ncbi:SusC/RagA family TonB-linked outer membrane protein [Alistipes senegalensis]|uniref:SusC/RagA family TonB-linked outer membrane protein n=1 Tax=Alistipes senegalensis JC50 TaxID=1033732 RepID=A0ABY5V8B4_9BACT|nr:SusC/RagA family TonB-linked outer membrane protein [Alistipes senegalensis]UEA86505.1 SusC/RagA family TonB-linked outer membrane protein [Alistipes senegalensis]UWN65906.1 SusC/RagA family TonB-linked outer membrane protein [Alistipes senegalensis JC50]